MLAPLPEGPLAPRLPGDAHFAVWSALELVADPEIPVVNLREMGILRAVRDSANGLEVVITPTYSGCPAMRQMNDDVVATLRSAGMAARVVTQLAPPWTTDWMTDTARDKLRAYGIAPPHACAVESAAAVISFSSKKRPQSDACAVACPQCGSAQTTEISHFGSTACKALYRCLSCLETFDYFKPY
ncbi:MAG: phenylacetate-CoA oxygenase subunit PaaJ [Rhodoferax sp.]|uniref:1,2-phenylacetyl-CoA epoxidase subunit PaaD n=1 Tax=Rhodoferax sp. TaxID=50421 RepID=UPI001B7B84B1|nr:1,2-phenylacetyl-CoA epoxidase subunit PaaD [Rhodoferax sp.]MBP9906485.1 phenylacetate-CoA oxygenase subunit PaaJ [Rhodoferax sp.]